MVVGMEKVNDTLYSLASIIDVQALEQAKTTASMRFVYPHVALMPDAHPGLRTTGGSVIPTVDAVMPAAVGVDIGCGMARRAHAVQRGTIALTAARPGVPARADRARGAVESGPVQPQGMGQRARCPAAPGRPCPEAQY